MTGGNSTAGEEMGEVEKISCRLYKLATFAYGSYPDPLDATTYLAESCDFKYESHKFFDALQENAERLVIAKGLEDYWPLIEVGYHRCISSRRYVDAVTIWTTTLKNVINSYQKNENLHKGTPYYWAGIAALLSGQVQKGFVFMEAARNEDKETSPGSTVTPAMLFFRLNTDNQNQAFYRYVQRLEERLKQYIDRYQERYNDTEKEKLDIDQLKKLVIEINEEDDTRHSLRLKMLMSTAELVSNESIRDLKISDSQAGAETVISSLLPLMVSVEDMAVAYKKNSDEGKNEDNDKVTDPKARDSINSLLCMCDDSDSDCGCSEILTTKCRSKKQDESLDKYVQEFLSEGTPRGDLELLWGLRGKALHKVAFMPELFDVAQAIECSIFSAWFYTVSVTQCDDKKG